MVPEPHHSEGSVAFCTLEARDGETWGKFNDLLGVTGEAKVRDSQC